ncbi:hypothetical protein BLNAU_16516 [Blattamonas nauphoetae]|uniref:Uncharacterized protein n=1 Tax=Blattamonas nauphoetae TaxID=2049346 RepID=A0ABQ9XB30_9EUKA|nr:hypothetical protein BLNAU_16516 [Blattamonas nauphoetae]
MDWSQYSSAEYNQFHRIIVGLEIGHFYVQLEELLDPSYLRRPLCVKAMAESTYLQRNYCAMVLGCPERGETDLVTSLPQGKSLTIPNKLSRPFSNSIFNTIQTFLRGLDQILLVIPPKKPKNDDPTPPQQNSTLIKPPFLLERSTQALLYLDLSDLTHRLFYTLEQMSIEKHVPPPESSPIHVLQIKSFNYVGDFLLNKRDPNVSLAIEPSKRTLSDLGFTTASSLANNDQSESVPDIFQSFSTSFRSRGLPTIIPELATNATITTFLRSPISHSTKHYILAAILVDRLQIELSKTPLQFLKEPDSHKPVIIHAGIATNKFLSLVALKYSKESNDLSVKKEWDRLTRQFGESPFQHDYYPKGLSSLSTIPSGSDEAHAALRALPTEFLGSYDYTVADAFPAARNLPNTIGELFSSTGDDILTIFTSSIKQHTLNQIRNLVHGIDYSPVIDHSSSPAGQNVTSSINKSTRFEFLTTQKATKGNIYRPSITTRTQLCAELREQSLEVLHVIKQEYTLFRRFPQFVTLQIRISGVYRQYRTAWRLTDPSLFVSSVSLSKWFPKDGTAKAPNSQLPLPSQVEEEQQETNYGFPSEEEQNLTPFLEHDAEPNFFAIQSEMNRQTVFEGKQQQLVGTEEDSDFYRLFGSLLEGDDTFTTTITSPPTSPPRSSQFPSQIQSPPRKPATMIDDPTPPPFPAVLIFNKALTAFTKLIHKHNMAMSRGVQAVPVTRSPNEPVPSFLQTPTSTFISPVSTDSLTSPQKPNPKDSLNLELSMVMLILSNFVEVKDVSENTAIRPSKSISTAHLLSKSNPELKKRSLNLFFLPENVDVPDKKADVVNVDMPTPDIETAFWMKGQRLIEVDSLTGNANTLSPRESRIKATTTASLWQNPSPTAISTDPNPRLINKPHGFSQLVSFIEERDKRRGIPSPKLPPQSQSKLDMFAVPPWICDKPSCSFSLPRQELSKKDPVLLETCIKERMGIVADHRKTHQQPTAKRTNLHLLNQKLLKQKKANSSHQKKETTQLSDSEDVPIQKEKREGESSSEDDCEKTIRTSPTHQPWLSSVLTQDPSSPPLSSPSPPMSASDGFILSPQLRLRLIAEEHQVRKDAKARLSRTEQIPSRNRKTTPKQSKRSHTPSSETKEERRQRMERLKLIAEARLIQKRIEHIERLSGDADIPESDTSEDLDFLNDVLVPETNETQSSPEKQFQLPPNQPIPADEHLNIIHSIDTPPRQLRRSTRIASKVQQEAADLFKTMDSSSEHEVKPNKRKKRRK